MKLHTLFSVILVLILAACAPAPAASPTAPVQAGRTPTQSPTSAAMLATPLPTATPVPTPTPTPTPVVINAQSATDVVEVGRLGNGAAHDLAISPDGRTLAIAGSLGIWLADAQTLQLLHLLEGHAGAVLSVDWSPDGSRLASGGEDGTVRVWEIASGRALYVHMPGAGVSVAWSPEGSRLASLHEGSLYVWDAASGELVRTMQTAITDPARQGLAWSPDGSRLAGVDEYGRMEVWDIESGRAVYEVRTANDTTVYALAWSPDSRWIATAHLDLVSGEITGQIRLWNAASGALVRTLSQQYGYFYSLAWSPDGTRLTTPGDLNSILVWDTASGRQTLRLEGHAARVTAVAWLPDGERLVSVGEDGALRAWDASTGEARQTAEGMFMGQVNSLAWSPDGSRLASGGEDETVRLWGMQADAGAGDWSMELFAGPQSPVNTVAWLPDGQLIAGEGAYIHLWDTEGQGRDIFLQGYLDQISCSPDGDQCVITPPGSTTVRMVTVATGEMVELSGRRPGLVPIAWSPDGRWIALGNQIWDTLHQRAIVLPGDLRVVHSVAWSPNGRLFAAGGFQQAGENLLYVWSAAEGEADWESPLVLSGHTGLITALAWSPAGDLLAAGDVSGVITLWAPGAESRPVRRLSGHSADVRTLAWSPDGLQLASGGVDGVIRLWSVPLLPPPAIVSGPPQLATSGLPSGWTGQPITAANAHTLAPLASLGRGAARDLALSPDGALLAVASGGRVRLYQTATWHLLASLPFVSNGEATAVAWSPDGARLAASGSIRNLWLGIDAARTVVWDTAAWQVQTVLGEPEGDISINAEALDLAWSADGQWLLTPYGYDLLEWNLATGRVQRMFNSRPLDFPNQYSLALTASGERVVVGGDSLAAAAR